MFGKRKTPVPAQPGAVASGGGIPARAGKLTTIIVPRSALDHAKNPETAYKLVGAVINYVNVLMSQGLYNRTEIPALAVQAYHADYYLAQVNNGGHRQFVHNIGDNLKHSLVDVPPALSAMKAEAQHTIFLQMKAWVDQFADAAAIRAALSSDKTALSMLDSPFYAAEKAASMSVLSARWIESWPELKAVEDADYQEAVRQIVLMNPLREQRLVWDAVRQLQFGMTDLLHAAVSMACLNIQHRDRSIEYLLKIRHGEQMKVDGGSERAWLVSTNKGPRFCVLSGSHVAVYQCIQPDNPPMPKFGDLEGMKAAISDGRLAQFRGPSIGNKLAQIPMQSVVDIIELAKSYNTAAGLDLLLQQAQVGSSKTMTTPRKIETGPLGTVGQWLVLADQRAFLLEAGPKGSALLGVADGQCIATVRRQDIDEHAAKAAAGSPAVT